MTDQKRRFEDQLPGQPLEWEGQQNPRTDEIRVERQQALLNCAAALLKAERAEASAVAFPGTAPEQYVMIGTADDILRLLPLPGATDGLLRAQMRDITTLLIERQDIDHLMNDPDLVRLLSALTTMAVNSAARSATPHAVAGKGEVPRLDADEICAIWNSMPGGPANWLKGWGYQQFAKAIEDEVLLNVERAASPATPAVPQQQSMLAALQKIRAMTYNAPQDAQWISEAFHIADEAIKGAIPSPGAAEDERAYELRRDAELAAMLPSVWYMDPPDGGNVPVLEQLRRALDDARRYRYLRNEQTDVGNVIDKEFKPGYWEYRSGAELDAAIDAAMGAAPLATPADAGADEQDQQQKECAPPFAAPAGQHDASEAVHVGNSGDVVVNLRDYASNAGYSHNDYADTMRQAANVIEHLRAQFFHLLPAQTVVSPAPVTAEPAQSIDTLDFHNLLRKCITSDDYPTHSARLIAYINRHFATPAPADRDAIRDHAYEYAAALCDRFAKRDMHPTECAGAIRMMKSKSMVRAADAAETRDVKGGEHGN